MIAQVLELAPSAAGWYYPYQPVADAPVRNGCPPGSAVRVEPEPATDTILGYGPDGRARLASAPPQLWLLA
jgi:hypothetical protein